MAYDVDRKPGAFAKEREAEDSRVFLVFVVLVVAAIGTSAALLVTRTTGIVTSLALLFVAFAAKSFADSRLDSAFRWGKGGNAEGAVGELLESLEPDGFMVLHDLESVTPGNVDHLVSGPTGAFMIETKFRRYRDEDIPKAKRAAAALARQLETLWVQPVICVVTRDYGPRYVKGVAVMGLDQLLPYIRTQANRPLPFENLARFADLQ